MRLVDRLMARESPELVALDISSSRVKLLELSGEPGAYRIESFSTEALPAQAISDNQLTEPELVGQTIARALKRAGCTQKQAAVAVSGSAVISKVIDMPATLSEDEIEQQIGFEADQYIPYPVEEVSLDFQVLGPAEHDPEMNRVLLAACRRDTVELYVAAVELAGLKAKVVDVEAYALQNACGLLIDQLPDGGREQTIAVVDFGATNTSVNVLHNGETIYTREQGFGGQQFVDTIRRHYDVEQEEAIAKLQNDDLDEDFRQGVLSDFAAQMAQQIERSLQFFFSSSTEHDNIDQVILVGGCAMLPDIEQLVAADIEIPVAIGNPLSGMRASGNARRNRVEQQAPALMVATGLAMRRFA